jgi:hypothetical protein
LGLKRRRLMKSRGQFLVKINTRGYLVQPNR